MRMLIVPALVLVMLVGSASALVIKQLEPDDSWAAADWSVGLVGDHIEVDLQKEFKSPEMVGSPLVLEFTLEANDIGKDIYLVHGQDGEEVINATGVPWSDFHFVLVNLPQVPFLPPPADAAFVDLAGVTSDVFGTPSAAGASQIDFLGGPVSAGGVVHFSGIHIAHNDTEGAVFYLKEIPTPEPGSFAVVCFGAGVLLFRRVRIRKR